jgi:hypothetical protein
VIKAVIESIESQKMNDENLDITPDPHKGIPEPEIPAYEAWNNMASLLDGGANISSQLCAINKYRHSDYTRLKISWQWHLILQLRWNFNDRLSFTISPSGTYYLNNLYDRNNKPPNIPFGIGMNVGLIYKFK